MATKLLFGEDLMLLENLPIFRLPSYFFCIYRSPFKEKILVGVTNKILSEERMMNLEKELSLFKSSSFSIFCVLELILTIIEQQKDAIMNDSSGE